MTLKNHLFVTGTVCVLLMSIAIAQDQAPRPAAQPVVRPPLGAADGVAEAPLNNAAAEVDGAQPPAVRPAGRPVVRPGLRPAAAVAADPLNNAVGVGAQPAVRAAQPVVQGLQVVAPLAAGDDDDPFNNLDEAAVDNGLDAPVTPPPRTVPGVTTPRNTGIGTGTTTRPGLTRPGIGSGLLGGTGLDGTDSTVAKANSSGKTNSLKFSEAPLEIVLGMYAVLTKKQPVVWPDVPKTTTITHKPNDDVELTKEESIWMLEQILSAHGIALEPIDEKFIKVLNKPTARVHGIPIIETHPESPHPENGQTISQMIILQHITAAEAQKALEGFRRPDGLFQVIERTNSILVTDTQENINRMLQVIKIIDQPIPVEEVPEIRIIRYAKAEDIKKRLEEFVAESQKQNQPKEEIRLNATGGPGVTRTTPTATTPGRPTPPGLVRPPVTPAPVTPLETSVTLIDDASRGMIKGKVHIMADERTNQLIIITRPENMKFFDQIIQVLDIETAPDIGVEVERLKYADAEEVASKLNDLIGNTSTAQRTATGGAANPAAPGTRQSGPGTSAPNAPPADTARGGSLADVIAARRDAAAAAANANAAPGATGETKLGQLSKDNIKILSDKRTNAIIMMGSRSDLAALKQIIEKMDIQLSQVNIEVVIVQVKLGSGINAGIDWVLGRAANDYVMGGRDKTMTAGGGGSGTPLLGNLTSIVTPNGSASGEDAVATVASHVLGQGINYFLQSDRLNISALIQAAASDSRAKVLASPILLTVDNKEASIEVTEMRYLYKGLRYSGSYNDGRELPDFEQRDIGLTVKITPRINPNGTVVLTIDEKFETIGADQDVGGQKFPTINTHKLTADISLEDLQTVVLGGLVQSESTKSVGGIPLLKDIPLVGRWLFGSVRDTEARSELLVFVTPQVFKDGSEASAEALRRKSVLSDPRPLDDGGWSVSPLADPVSTKIRLQRQGREWADADQEYKAEREMQKAREERAKQLMERAKKDAVAAEKKLRNARNTDTLPPPTVRVGGEGVQVFFPGDDGD